MTAIAVIINRKHEKHADSALWQSFKTSFPQAVFFFTDYSGHATELSEKVAAQKNTIIVAVGGDGTINEVVNGMMLVSAEIRDTLSLAILPIGTGNDFVKSTGLNHSMEMLIQAIQQNKSIQIDLGSVTYQEKGESKTRFFANIADAGIGGLVAKKFLGLVRWLPANLAYQISILRAFLGFKHAKVEIKGDNFEYKGKLLSLCAANGQWFGSGLGIAPHADIRDGHLAFVILGDVSLFDYLKYLPKVKKKAFISHPSLFYYKGKYCDINVLEGENLIELDGEFLGSAPAKMNIHPKAISLIGMITFLLLFLPALLFSQPLRDSKQFLYTVSKNELIENTTSVFTFKLDFNHQTPFHCASIAWNENHKKEKPNASFLFSFSKDSIVWTKWESLVFDEHAIDIRDQFATNLIFFEKDYPFVKMQLVDSQIKTSNAIEELKINFFSPGMESAATSFQEPFVEKSSCACPQPKFKSRVDWRCPQGPTSPSLTTVSHLIVHHSAGTNVSNDWGAIVLAIWNLHVYTNGWADVGYNWLISPDGTLFEGRGGGDNVLGAHFCGKNTGTMGVCLIGTYTNVNPPDTMMKKLSEIFAWKACQRSVDPNIQSFHASTGFNLFGISGHRDGCSTECPGQKVYDQISLIRKSTQDNLTACSATYVDEMPEGLDWINIRPNPVQNTESHIDFFLSQLQPFSYQILNSQGQFLLEEKLSVQLGLNSFTIKNIQNLPKGTYLIRFQFGQKVRTKTLLVP